MILNTIEEKVIKLVAAGHNNLEIGYQLGYSQWWVKKFLRQIYKTYGLKNKNHLTACYYKYYHFKSPVETDYEKDRKRINQRDGVDV